MSVYNISLQICRVKSRTAAPLNASLYGFCEFIQLDRCNDAVYAGMMQRVIRKMKYHLTFRENVL